MMDESEQYIKMSDCPEIQGQRKPKIEKMLDGRWHYEWELEVGDYFATRDLYSKEERQIEIKGTTIYDPYFYDKKQDANIDIGQVGFDEGEGYITKKFTWLPRQDQIQEMISEKLFAGLFVLDDTDVGARLSYMTGRFKDFVHTKCEKMIPLEKNRARIEYLFNSMEQLWLAFYMYEKHGKTWDGNKWIKEKEE